MRNWLWYAIGVIGSTAALSLLGLTQQQALAVAGFASVLWGAIFFWESRLVFAFLGVAGLMTANLLDVHHLIEFAGLDIILFLIAMMTIIGFMEEREFFEHMIDRLLLAIGPHPRTIMVVLMIAAAISAALVDEVTSILFMSAAMLSLIEKHDVDPVPFIMMLVFTTNIGSSATVVGNPVGVIIALRSGLGFMDFLRLATPISLICLIVTVASCLFIFRKDIALLKGILSGRKGEERLLHMVEDDKATRREVRKAGYLFAAVILGLVLHHPVENLLGLPSNTMLLGF